MRALVFVEGGWKTGEHGEKLLEQGKNQLSSHMYGPWGRITPGPHCWEANATLTPSLLPCISLILLSAGFLHYPHHTVLPL